MLAAAPKKGDVNGAAVVGGDSAKAVRADHGKRQQR
jgi:hypothetical protein